MTGTLLRGRRAGEVIVRVTDVGPVPRIKRHLQEVGKTAAVTSAAASSARANGSVRFAGSHFTLLQKACPGKLRLS
jgi:hypothetical protein